MRTFSCSSEESQAISVGEVGVRLIHEHQCIGAGGERARQPTVVTHVPDGALGFAEEDGARPCCESALLVASRRRAALGQGRAPSSSANPECSVGHAGRNRRLSARVASRTDALVLVDEAYADFWLTPDCLVLLLRGTRERSSSLARSARDQRPWQLD